MKKLYVPTLSEEQKVELEALYRKTAIPRIRTRAPMILLSAETGLNTEEVVDIVCESSVTVLRWLHRYSLWTLQRLADFMAEETGSGVSTETIRRVLAKNEIVIWRPQHTLWSPVPEYQVKKRRLKKRVTN